MNKIGRWLQREWRLFLVCTIVWYIALVVGNHL